MGGRGVCGHYAYSLACAFSGDWPGVQSYSQGMNPAELVAIDYPGNWPEYFGGGKFTPLAGRRIWLGVMSQEGWFANTVAFVKASEMCCQLGTKPSFGYP